MNLNKSLKEIAEYQKKDFESVLTQYNEVAKKQPGYVKWSNLSANEWDEMKIDQHDVQKVMEFYKKTPNYIFELMEYHSTEAKQRLSNTVIDICKKNNIRSILDFGAGICNDSINEAKNNLKLPKQVELIPDPFFEKEFLTLTCSFKSREEQKKILEAIIHSEKDSNWNEIFDIVNN